jgi:hypothetical protein
MAVRESAFQTEVIRYLRSVGGKTHNIHGHAMQERGIPDLWLSHREWFGWLELKVRHHLTEVQRAVIAAHMDRGVPAFVVRGSMRSCRVSDQYDQLLAQGPFSLSLLVEAREVAVRLGSLSSM